MDVHFIVFLLLITIHAYIVCHHNQSRSHSADDNKEMTLKILNMSQNTFFAERQVKEYTGSKSLSETLSMKKVGNIEITILNLIVIIHNDSTIIT